MKRFAVAAVFVSSVFASATLVGAAEGTADRSASAYSQFANASPPWQDPRNLVASADPLVVKGAYLARAGDCIACHTVEGGAPYAGGLALQSPFGTIHSTNITPDKQHGIGAYTYEDFATVLRTGVAPGGRHLYPAMPYPSYSKIDDDDMHALYAYFMQGVKPAAVDNQANGLRFPFNVRAVMIGWNMLFRPSGVYRTDAGQSAEWNRGAYLVQGLEHCGACHTPHGATEQEKAFDARDNTVYLSGFNLGDWHAPNLRSDVAGGLGRWDVDGLVAFLRSGRNAHTAAFGAMTEAIGDSTQYLTDEDLRSMAVYLKSLPPKSGGSSTFVAASSPLPNPLREGRIDSAGAKLYLDNCNACHRSDGSGASRVFPALAGNSAVLGDDATSLIHIVLDGSHMASTAASPAALGMPPFGWRLDDQQVADVLTYVRSTWGNQAPAVTAQTVAALRH